MAASILALFFCFSAPGLQAGFTHDDLMNAYNGLRAPVSEHLRDVVIFFRFSRSFRPAGALFYRALFEGFGFNPFPFRVACYSLLVVNLWLAYCLVRRLTRSRETGILTVLLFAYHGGFSGLYLNTGFCYDILCFFFYTAAFLYYVRIRQRSQMLNVWQILVWSSIYVLALDSKEMAVSLPVLMLVYELQRKAPDSWRWPLHEGRVALIGAAITLMFIAGRLTGDSALTTMDAYRPVLWPSVYVDRLQHFLWEASYRSTWMKGQLGTAVAVLVGSVAAREPSRALHLGLAWILIGILPIAFIIPRGLDASYIPALGLALCLAATVREVSRRLAPLDASRRQILIFGALMALLACIHVERGRIDLEGMTTESRHIHKVYEQLRTIQPAFPDKSHVLFLNDPFPVHDWATIFLVNLHSHGRIHNVLRRDRLVRTWDPAVEVGFNLVFTYEDDRLVRCDPAPFSRVSIRELNARTCSPLTSVP